MDKKYMRVNHNNKTVIIDVSIKPTERELMEYDSFIRGGYTPRMKSQARSESAKSRTTGRTGAEILDALKDDPVAAETFDNIWHGKATNEGGKAGFFAAVKWYDKEYGSSRKDKKTAK